MIRKMVIQMIGKCVTTDEDIFCPSSSWQLLAHSPWPVHHEGTRWHNLESISIYSQYLSGLHHYRETGLVEAQRGAWRGQVDYPSKLAVRQLSCLLGFALAAASRTFWKRPQDEPGCAASTTKASITATVERPKGERNFNKTKTKKKNTPFFENTSFSKSVGLTTSASTTLTLPRCRRVVRITRCQMP